MMLSEGKLDWKMNEKDKDVLWNARSIVSSRFVVKINTPLKYLVTHLVDCH